MTDWAGLLSDMTATVRDTFGEPVSYWRFGTPSDQWITTALDGSPLRAIFDPDHVRASAGGEVGVNVHMLALDIRIADLGFNPDQEDRVRVQGKEYKVVTPHPSSSGNRLLELRKV